MADGGTRTTQHLPCDMIMKGGITSGIVYPRAAERLSHTYTFRRLGGTSAGAIAAVLVAAAEHGRYSPHGGFKALERVPDTMSTGLSTLFRPEPETAAAFAVLTAALEGVATRRAAVATRARRTDATRSRRSDATRSRRSGVTRSRRSGVTRRALAAARRASLDAPGPFLAGLAVGYLALLVVTLLVAGLPTHPADWLRLAGAALLWLPLAVAVGLGAALATVARRTIRALPGLGFGLCRGHRAESGRVREPRPADQPPAPSDLTDWMTDELDYLAGLSPQEGPLRFGHLWHGPTWRLGVTGNQTPERDDRAVDVEVMTTDLTVGRPIRFPFLPASFLFCDSCLRDYFPARVVDALAAPVTAAEPAAELAANCPRHPDVPLRPFPAPAQLPVVLAARLSLSFPLLISAVPLYAVDEPTSAEPRVVTHWISDGGIASNFPMHLFDAPWPRRPTFGISLTQQDQDNPEVLTWRDTSTGEGIRLRPRPIGSVSGFVAAIADTAQNWADTTLAGLPGYRDRIVEVRQLEGEGGLNLRMPPQTVRALAARGAEAADWLLPDGTAHPPFQYQQHRWIRYRVMMSRLDDTLERMRRRYGGADGVQRLLAEREVDAVPYPLADDEAKAADSCATEELMLVAEKWRAAGSPHDRGVVPKPQPDLRIVPRP